MAGYVMNLHALTTAGRRQAGMNILVPTVNLCMQKDLSFEVSQKPYDSLCVTF